MGGAIEDKAGGIPEMGGANVGDKASGIPRMGGGNMSYIPEMGKVNVQKIAFPKWEGQTGNKAGGILEIGGANMGEGQMGDDAGCGWVLQIGSVGVNEEGGD